MEQPLHQIRMCMRPECHFRFPLPAGADSDRCPKCGGPTRIVEMPYPAMHVPDPTKEYTHPPIEALLDNIRSTFNVGAMFRTADGAGLKHLHLCGITPTPDHPKVGKTALGAEKTIPWTQYWDGQGTAQILKNQGYRLWALEGGQNSQNLFTSLSDLHGTSIVLVVGNEVSGVDPGILALCDRKIYIPMAGVKESLNVSIAFGVAVYTLCYGYQISNKSYETGPDWENS
jgi:23S rRNA (guanosine2251-2'-O)-methyltransferase